MKKTDDAIAQKKNPEFQEEDYFRALYDETERGFLELDSRDRIIAANHAGANILGTSRALLKGKTLSSFMPSRHRKLHTEKKKELKRTGKAQQYEGELLRGDGMSVPVMLIRQRFKTVPGREYVIINDISSKMALMKELVVFREKCHYVFESALDGMVVLNKEKIVTLCNRAFEAIFKMERKEIVGK